MAEIVLEPISLGGNALLIGASVKTVSSASLLQASAIASAQVVLIVKSEPVSAESQASLTGRFVLVVSTAASSASKASMPAVPYIVIKYVDAKPSAEASARASAHKYKTVSGALLTTSSLETYTYDRDIRQTMKDYMPKYYDDFADVMRMVETEANEVTRIQAKLNQLLDQYYVNSATVGLDRWEALTDIEKKAARSTDSRRHYINAKLRGVGTVTRELINEIVDSFYEATVEEIPEEMTMKIKLTGRRGVPKNFEDIERSVVDVMPAHVGTDFSFSFMPWHELDMIRQKWSVVNELKMAEVAVTPWREFEGTGARWTKVAVLTAGKLEESYDLNKGELPNEQSKNG